MPRLACPLFLLCALALLVPVAATAQEPAPTAIDGSPLNIWAAPSGSIQVNVDGYPASEWFPQKGFDPNTNEEIPSQTANNGFGLIVEPTTNPQFFGNWITGSMPQPDSGPTFTAGDPATITTTWTLLDASTQQGLLRVTQLISYKNGERQFDTTWTVQNISDRRLTFRANVGGDLAIRGTDQGVGILNAGPPRFVGGLNIGVGAAGGFVEQTPWSSYEANDLGSVRGHASDTGKGFDTSINPDAVDNAVGVQWDDHFAPGSELGAGATATYQVGWRFYDTLSLTPPQATRAVGDLHTLTAKVFDQNGNPVDHQTVGYRVDGVNPQSGSLNTGADGTVKIEYVGGVVGSDVVTAFVDANGNKELDENETQTTATVEWTGPDLAPPTIGSSANAQVVKGKVKIKLPKGTSFKRAKALGLPGAQKGFATLTDAAQIPMGSTLDTSRGTVQLLTAGSRPNSTTLRSTYQSGKFNGGQFLVSQGRKNPLVQMSMRGGKLNGCKTAVPKGGAAAVRKRRIFGNARGRFRTRGRHSSATVRGTKWSMTDTCAGTLTVVSRGTVTVRDFGLRKNKTVKAGKRYFAKARKLKKSKRHRLG